MCEPLHNLRIVRDGCAELAQGALVVLLPQLLKSLKNHHHRYKDTIHPNPAGEHKPHLSPHAYTDTNATVNSQLSTPIVSGRHVPACVLSLRFRRTACPDPRYRPGSAPVAPPTITTPHTSEKQTTAQRLRPSANEGKKPTHTQPKQGRLALHIPPPSIHTHPSNHTFTPHECVPRHPVPRRCV